MFSFISSCFNLKRGFEVKNPQDTVFPPPPYTMLKQAWENTTSG